MPAPENDQQRTRNESPFVSHRAVESPDLVVSKEHLQRDLGLGELVEIRQANCGNERHHFLHDSTNVFPDVERVKTSAQYIPKFRTEREPFPLFAGREPWTKGINELFDRIEANCHVDGSLQ